VTKITGMAKFFNARADMEFFNQLLKMPAESNFGWHYTLILLIL